MIELTVDNFGVEVLEQETPVLVDWWGETCENCLALMPDVEELYDQYGELCDFTWSELCFSSYTRYDRAQRHHTNNRENYNPR